MKYTYLALAVQEPSGWVAVSISVLALVATLGNYFVTLWRGRKHVRMHVRLRVDVVGERDPAGVGSIDYDREYRVVYSCKVTNSGFIGVTIDRVAMYLRDPGLRNRLETYIRLRTGHIQPEDELDEDRAWEERLTRLRFLKLLKDEDPRKLDPGESQVWGVYIKGATKKRMLSRLYGRAVDTKIIAVAVDTTGKIYWQKTKDAITKNDFMKIPGVPKMARDAGERGDAPPAPEPPAERPWWRRIFGT